MLELKEFFGKDINYGKAKNLLILGLTNYSSRNDRKIQLNLISQQHTLITNEIPQNAAKEQQPTTTKKKTFLTKLLILQIAFK